MTSDVKKGVKMHRGGANDHRVLLWVWTTSREHSCIRQDHGNLGDESEFGRSTTSTTERQKGTGGARVESGILASLSK